MMYNSNLKCQELQQLNSSMDSFSAEEMELIMASEFMSFNDNYNSLSQTCVDHLLNGLDDNLSFSDDNYNSSLPYLLSNPCEDQFNFTYFAPELFSQQDFDQFRYEKRQKTYEDNYYIDPMNTFLDGIVPNPNLLHDFTVPEVMVPPSPQVSSSNGNAACAGNCVKKFRATEKTLSAQSMAARQRRRKITEKTQELGKLIPGGQRMNTAEMFQAAFKYIKYMQAQVSVLESMGSFEDIGEEHEHPSEDLQALVGSSFVQEKLYSTEKCLVPRKFIEALANDHEIQSNVVVLKELKQLV